MRKFLIILPAIFLVGCGLQAPSDSDKTNSGNVYETKVDLEDGRTITCLIYKEPRRGGLSCDWDPKEK